jgi:glycosyltransferase involved in cell wall biosynthesis
MKVILSHPTGNQNVRNLVQGLNDKDLLDYFFTTFGVYDDNIFSKLKFGPFAELSRRSYSSELKGHIKFHPLLEFYRLLSIKLKYRRLYNSDTSIFSDARIFENFDKYVASKLKNSNFDIIYSYAGSSLNTFREASKLGKFKLYEQHGCYWQLAEDITNSEYIKNPEWKETLPFLQISQIRKENESEELLLSDEIIVASEFCKKSISDITHDKKINVIPYGFSKPIENRKYSKVKKIKLLFVGNLSQLKGLSYLFDAVNSYSQYLELTIIGSLPNLNSSILNNNLKKYNYLGTMNHQSVLFQMQQHDILIFPTLLDAFGMVITEAMSQGTPVITTTNSGGPELISHNEDGWIVEAGQSESIKQIIEELLLDRRLVEEFGQNALKKASSRSWLDYQNDICNLIGNLKVL